MTGDNSHLKSILMSSLHRVKAQTKGSAAEVQKALDEIK
jgi:hypothetical protein